jgi:hypothetical protein
MSRIVHCGRISKIEITEILNRGDLDKPQCLIQAPNNNPMILFRFMAAVSQKLLPRQIAVAPRYVPEVY